jgi:hypothetical protein
VIGRGRSVPPEHRRLPQRDLPIPAERAYRYADDRTDMGQRDQTLKPNVVVHQRVGVVDHDHSVGKSLAVRARLIQLVQKRHIGAMIANVEDPDHQARLVTHRNTHS